MERKPRKFDDTLEPLWPPQEVTMTSISTDCSNDSTSRQDELFVLTKSGSKLWIRSPHQDQIHREDIIAALPKLCRYTGHCKEFYSVAQHSVLALRMAKLLGCGPTHQSRALIHDFAEAYVNDLNSPVKNAIHQSYRDFESRLDNIISVKLLGVPHKAPPVVKTIDVALYHIESLELMPGNPDDHLEALSALGMAKVAAEIRSDFECWSWQEGEDVLRSACDEMGL